MIVSNKQNNLQLISGAMFANGARFQVVDMYYSSL